MQSFTKATKCFNESSRQWLVKYYISEKYSYSPRDIVREIQIQKGGKTKLALYVVRSSGCKGAIKRLDIVKVSQIIARDSYS